MARDFRQAAGPIIVSDACPFGFGDWFQRLDWFGSFRVWSGKVLGETHVRLIEARRAGILNGQLLHK